MARYIDAEKLLEELQEELEFDTPMYTKEQNEWVNRGLKIAINDIKRIPTADVVEVVRCKDCVHSKPIDTIVSCRHYKPECIICSCEEVAGDGAMVYFPNHYCSYGEKKKEAEI